MIGAFFGGLGWRGWAAIAAGLTILALVWTVRSSDRQAGGAVVRDQINAANRTADSKADAGERDVLKCPAGKWNREAGRCGTN